MMNHAYYKENTTLIEKSSNLASEVSFMPYLNTPLLDSIEKGIANPANFVEENNDGFLRGAIGTRDANRDVMKKQ